MSLFRSDMFSMFESGTTPPACPPDDGEYSAALEICSELIDNEDHAVVLELTKGLVQSALRQSDHSPGQQALLALYAYSESRLAVSDERWSAAADWVFTAMNRCSPSNEPKTSQPFPQQYLLLCGAMLGGHRVIEFEPSQLHVRLDEDSFHDLAIGYVRLLTLGPQRLNEAIRGLAPLRNRIIEDLWLTGDLSKGRRKGETDIVELAYQRSAHLFEEFRAQAETLRDMKGFTHGQGISSRLIRLLSQEKRMLLSDEQRDVNSVREVLGRQLSALIKAEDSKDPVERRRFLDTFLTETAIVLSSLEGSGLFARTIAIPPIKYVREAAAREVGFAESEVVPELKLRQSRKRYPLHQVGDVVGIQVELTNRGRGSAERGTVSFRSQPSDGLIFAKPMPLRIPVIPPGGTCNVECPVRLDRQLDRLVLELDITCHDVFAREFHYTDTLVIEKQSQEPDWERLMDRRPYSLTPASSLESLRGRASHLDSLRMSTAVGTSAVLWGQKRVGKTSLATVFEGEVVDSSRFVSIYVRRGEVVGFSEGQIARTLALRIAAKVPDLNLEVPEEEWFGPHLTRLSEWLNKARSEGLSRGILIVLDEFDEIPAIYLGERGANFFSTLRSLSEQGVVWLFVGSERMPNIFLRHHATLNQVEVYKVDRVTDPMDIEDMVVGPVRGMIDWDPEAIELVRLLSAGNPYYVHLICIRILREMYHFRRTFVDRADVATAARAITFDSSESHWGHFWEENNELEPAKRERKAALSALVLAALGACWGTAPIGRRAIIEALESFEVDDEDLAHAVDLLPELVQRGVVAEISIQGDIRYNTVVPLFGEYLSQHCRTTVYSHYERWKQKAAPITPTPEPNIILQVDSFPVNEEDLINLSEGFVYQGVPIDAQRIKNWLRQFPNDTAIRSAAKLLKRSRDRYYIDIPRIRHAINDSYTWVLDQMNQSEIALQMRSSRVARVRNIFVTYLGPSEKSGAAIAREFKTQKRFDHCAAVDDAISWLQKSDPNLPLDHRYLLVVDDFVGSGTTARDGLLPLVNRIRKDKNLTRWAEQGRILFTPLWAFAEGVDLVESEVGDLVRIQAARNLDVEDMAFHEDAKIFDSDDERRYAEQVFRHIGQQLVRDYPLGFGNSQALVVFEGTIPNNSLPTLWCPGTVDEKPWKPLFQRP